ncbi:MAG: hypothetical protein Q9191_003661 [Dirinaria sp. TL-2023a]
MTSSIEAPHQYKQTSRKGKKAWRKHVDVSDIQIGLDNVREEIIQGGVISEKPSNELFAVDTAGSENIQKSYNKAHRPLTADEILASRSAVPAIDSRKRSGTTDGVIEPRSKRTKHDGVSRKEYERLRNIAFGGAAVQKEMVMAGGAPDYDLWVCNGDELVQDSMFDYLEKSKPVRAPRTLKEAPISLIEGSISYPAVPKPHAGRSYNPVFESWDQLLVEEGNKEIEAERKRIKEAEEEQLKLDRIAAAQTAKEDLQTEEESAWEGFESEFERSDWLDKRRPQRKTPAERNKMKRRKEAARQQKIEVETKKRAQQEHKIKEIARGIDTETNARAVAISGAEHEPLEVDEDAGLRRRKLGVSAVPDRSLELVLPDELQDSLRLLKPEGNLLNDRYRNILLRGKVESRRPIHQPKKARRKITEKWTSKDFVLPV